MKTLRYICAQPAIKYYTWQVEVLINNFIKMGVNPNNIDILCGIDNDIIPDDWVKLMNHYNSVRFFFYNDIRTDKMYQPSIYFHLMKQHIKHRPEIQNDVLFLHDSDIVLTRPPKFDDMIYGNSWYLSNTNSYINYDYIKSKGDDVYDNMCRLVGIDPLIPKLMNSNSGGAQYIVKNTTYEFWDKVENDSVKLYRWFCDNEHLYVKKHDGDYPIQKWTAGMWSLLWNAWLFGHETIVDKRLDFGWVTNNISDVENYPILHNAGVTSDPNSPHSYEKGLFYKANFMNDLPYNKPLVICDTYASHYYWNEICETAKVSCLV
jgi:hypothetical protein